MDGQTDRQSRVWSCQNANNNKIFLFVIKKRDIELLGSTLTLSQIQSTFRSNLTFKLNSNFKPNLILEFSSTPLRGPLKLNLSLTKPLTQSHPKTQPLHPTPPLYATVPVNPTI